MQYLKHPIRSLKHTYLQYWHMTRSYLVHEIVKQISTKYLYEVHYQTSVEENDIFHQSSYPFQEDIDKAISKRFRQKLCNTKKGFICTILHGIVLKAMNVDYLTNVNGNCGIILYTIFPKIIRGKFFPYHETITNSTNATRKSHHSSYLKK